ncbi:hypothetical protein TC41_0020 [Alicyclobacillus acidocaldarius subsp. acidocaldarius Tc-4-1]|uniref:Uncharacterized protein n=1 Tax=Alicyclobacillus acidocaldarius (strain Tc-4-1) TaxID=1048834 RepID=F8IHN4_ALIAT|nr:hypothetical protein TC41_0020 [Alicyclobacillus acidocaldarius subsp. acidocaldarius Tc-4-1]
MAFRRTNSPRNRWDVWIIVDGVAFPTFGNQAEIVEMSRAFQA